MEKERGDTNRFERFDNLLQYKNLKQDKILTQKTESTSEKEKKNVNLINSNICTEEEIETFSTNNEAKPCDTELLSKTFVQYYHDVLKMLTEKNTEFIDANLTNFVKSHQETTINTKNNLPSKEDIDTSCNLVQLQTQITHIENMLEDICHHGKEFFDWLDQYCRS